MQMYLYLIMMLFSTHVLALENYANYGRGLTVPPDWMEKAEFVKVEKSTRALPATFDWREKVKLSPVKNQGQCGSCWAFSTTATWRDAMIVQAGEAGDGSEQNVLECNRQGYGCDGGYFDVSEIWVTPGAVREGDYKAYSASKGACNKSATKFAKALSWKYLQDTSVDGIKAGLMKYGPVSVGVAAADDWSNYRGGILKGSACKGTQLNHAVQIVGWGEGHWIIRNSWGTGWGENGYIRIAFDCDQVGELPNVIIYKDGTPNPTPEPTPDPNPDPNPNPTPEPTPDPKPCVLPSVKTGYPATYLVRPGKTYLMGGKSQPKVSYLWTAEPAFSNNSAPKSAQIKYSPYMTKKITITGTNECGSSSASTNMVIPNTKGKDIIYH